MLKRVILIIFDACGVGGVGALPDAADYGDSQAATIPNIARELNGLNMPNCQKLGRRETFSDVACTLAEIFELGAIFPGKSFLNELKII